MKINIKKLVGKVYKKDRERCSEKIGLGQVILGRVKLSQFSKETTTRKFFEKKWMKIEKGL